MRRRPAAQARDCAARERPRPFPSHRLDQHGAALAAADALGGDTLLDAEPLHRIDEVEHDAVAARPDRMTEPDGAAVDVELVAIDAADGAIDPEHLLAEGLVLPGSETGEHLRRERLVQLPESDIVERQLVPSHQRGRA